MMLFAVYFQGLQSVHWFSTSSGVFTSDLLSSGSSMEPNVEVPNSDWLLYSCCNPTRAEQELALQKLREEWESVQEMEKENLERKKQLALEKMKLEMEEAQQKETIRLEKEKEQFLRELKERLEMEKKKVRLFYYQLEPDPCCLC